MRAQRTDGTGGANAFQAQHPFVDARDAAIGVRETGRRGAVTDRRIAENHGAAAIEGQITDVGVAHTGGVPGVAHSVRGVVTVARQDMVVDAADEAVDGQGLAGIHAQGAAIAAKEDRATAVEGETLRRMQHTAVEMQVAAVENGPGAGVGAGAILEHHPHAAGVTTAAIGEGDVVDDTGACGGAADRVEGGAGTGTGTATDEADRDARGTAGIAAARTGKHETRN